MSASVLKKVKDSGFLPEEIISAYMMQEITAVDDIDLQLHTQYQFNKTQKMLPRFIQLIFSEDGKEVIDILICPQTAEG